MIGGVTGPDVLDDPIPDVLAPFQIFLFDEGESACANLAAPRAMVGTQEGWWT